MAGCSLGLGSFAVSSPSPRPVSLCPHEAAQESGMSRGRSECPGAAGSRAVLGQCTPGTKLSVSTISITEGHHLAKSECNSARTKTFPYPRTSHLSYFHFLLQTLGESRCIQRLRKKGKIL